MSRTVQIPTAKVFRPLLEPARYKGAFGGRGSGKSHNYGDNVVADSLEHKGLLTVCIREIQKSLKHSAKLLIENKLRDYGLGEADGFKVFRDVIETPGDGIIIFQGMQDHNAESIKSLEGFGRCWAEEAQTLSHNSLRMLRPTMRAKDAEMWFSWNPRRKNDPVDAMFRQGAGPTGSILVNANWDDNPWFPPGLEQERLDCLANEPDEYPHIWDGEYLTVTKGAYYAQQIIQAKQEGRYTTVPEDPIAKVRLFMDIGGTGAKSDAFAIWAAQFIGPQVRCINYYEAQGQDIKAHLAWLHAEGYTPGRASIWLPHDGKTNDRVIDVSYESAFKQAGYDVTVVPNQGKGAAAARIERTRTLFPAIYFDEQKCSTYGGLEALGAYHERIDEVRNIGLGPEHDWASHGADAFGLMCIVYAPPSSGPPPNINFSGWGS